MDSSDRPRPPGNRYSVTESEEFLGQAAGLLGSQRAWDDIKESFDEDVSRDPYLGERIAGTHLYALATNTWPQWTIYYTISERARTVCLIAVWED